MKPAKFKIEDVVRCIEGDSGLYKGFGWRKDLEFKINRITEDDRPIGRYIYWGEHTDGGVYEEFLMSSVPCKIISKNDHIKNILKRIKIK